MDTLLGTLRQTREQLAARGAKLAQDTRARGLSALGKVRSGATDWRRTVATRKAELGDQPSGWFRFVRLQVTVLDRVDRALALFSDRVKSEMKRLRRLELPRSTQPKTEARAAEPEARVRRATKTARAKTNGKAAPAAPKRLVLPIADYESLTAKDILAELPRLSDSQCETIRAHELAHKKRKTILNALSARLAS